MAMMSVNPNEPKTNPPTDKGPLWVMRFGSVDDSLIEWDPTWGGGRGSWFTDRGVAVKTTDIVCWRLDTKEHISLSEKCEPIRYLASVDFKITGNKPSTWAVEVLDDAGTWKTVCEFTGPMSAVCALHSFKGLCAENQFSSDGDLHWTEELNLAREGKIWR